MRLLAASIVILLLAFSLAHAAEFKDEGQVPLFQCFKAQKNGMEIYNAGEYSPTKKWYFIEKAYWVEGGGSLNGSIYALMGQIPFKASDKNARLFCFHWVGVNN